MPTATTWFYAQHERIRDGLDSWAAMRRMEGLEAILEDLADLRAVATAELYPLAVAVGTDTAVERCREDHSRMARIAAYVRSTRGPDLVDAVRLLCEVFVSYASFEESAVLDVIETRADASQLDALGTAVDSLASLPAGASTADATGG